MEKTRLKRFNTIERVSHVVLIVTFLTQGASGLARMYIETPWGKGLSRVFGGYDSALTVHKYVGLVMILAFLLHLVYLAFRIRWRKFPSSLMAPDSMFPQPRDVTDFFHHIAWFFGKGPHPRLDRWGYWEKVDYLGAVFWGMLVMGTTGLILAFPLISTRIIPGWGLNVALWVHRIEGMLAMGHVFIIHFAVAHLRRQNFPMDRTMFEGSADLDALRHEKPAWIDRLEQEGKLGSLLVPEAGPTARVLYYVFGCAAILCGVFLLIGGLLNSTRITW